MSTVINVNAIENESIAAEKVDSSFSSSYQAVSDKVDEITSESTDEQYPGASAVYQHTLNNYVSINSDQTFTPIQRQAVLTKIGLADEIINLTLTSETPSSIIGAKVTVEYDENADEYIWQGTTLSIVIPMLEEYTITFSPVTGLITPATYQNTAKKNKVRTITVSYDSAPYTDLSMKDINGNDLTVRETANCYVIKDVGHYEIPLVYGCAIKDGIENPSSYTQIVSDYTQPFYNYLNNQITSPFIETDTGNNAMSVEIMYSDVAINQFTISGLKIVQKDLCTYLRFAVDTFPERGGNAMIGVKDENGQVMWSWHIWAYGDILTTMAHTNTTGYTYNMLSVNLGWVKDNDSYKYGTCPYYQWGRKDPMLRAFDSNTLDHKTLVGYGRWSELYSTASSLASAIQNPNIQYTQRNTDYNCNWWSNSNTAVNFYNYWDASHFSYVGLVNKNIVKTIYDPCPAGFNIPCGNTFTGFTSSNGGTYDKGYTWDGRYFPKGANYWKSSNENVNAAHIAVFGENYVYPNGFEYNRITALYICPIAYTNF